MYETTLNLQNKNNSNVNVNQRNAFASFTNTKDAQLMSNLSLAIDEGEFVLVGANSLSARFTPPKPQPQYDFGRMGKRSATTVSTLARKEEKNEDAISDSLMGPLLGTIFPGFELLEMLNHGREMVEKLNDTTNKSITLTQTRNINPIDAINPNKAFLPVSPMYAPEKPAPLLWDRVRSEKATKEEENKKKRRIGLRSF